MRRWAICCVAPPRVVDGVLELRNELRSPAIGFTGSANSDTHGQIVQGRAWLEDWIYVDGPGNTAPGFVDTPDRTEVR